MYYSVYYSIECTNANFFDDFLKIYKQFTKVSEDSPKVVWAPDNLPYIFQKFMQIAEDFWR